MVSSDLERRHVGLGLQMPRGVAENGYFTRNDGTFMMSEAASDYLFAIEYPKQECDFAACLVELLAKSEFLGVDGLGCFEPVFEGLEISVQSKELIARRIREKLFGVVAAAITEELGNRCTFRDAANNLIAK